LHHVVPNLDGLLQRLGLWDGVSEVKDLIYSMESVKPSYIGLTEAPPNNIMPGR
jgi:hypothetical protein